MSQGPDWSQSHNGSPSPGAQSHAYGQQAYDHRAAGTDPCPAPSTELPAVAYGSGSESFWRADPSERQTAVLTHVGSILLGLIVPLIVFLVKKDDSPFIREQSRQSLNLAIITWIGLAVSSALMFVLIGFVTAPLVAIYSLVVSIIAAVSASRGEVYRIPFVPQIIR